MAQVYYEKKNRTIWQPVYITITMRKSRKNIGLEKPKLNEYVGTTSIIYSRNIKHIKYIIQV
jgi:hypothetical protein